VVVSVHVVRDISSLAEAIQIFHSQKKAHKEPVLKPQNYHLFMLCGVFFQFNLLYLHFYLILWSTTSTQWHLQFHSKATKPL